jgi:hypothetical protein
MPHINYGNVFFNVAFNFCLRYVHEIPRREHVSHLVPTIISVSCDSIEDSPFDVFV